VSLNEVSLFAASNETKIGGKRAVVSEISRKLGKAGAVLRQ
jgi:hypothetical protein